MQRTEIQTPPWECSQKNPECGEGNLRDTQPDLFKEKTFKNREPLDRHCLIRYPPVILDMWLVQIEMCYKISIHWILKA